MGPGAGPEALPVPILPSPFLEPTASGVASGEVRAYPWLGLGFGAIQKASSPQSSLSSPPTPSLLPQEAVRLWHAICSAL